MALLFPPAYRVTDRNGEALELGKIYVYLNNTTTLANIFSDGLLKVPANNPMTLDGGGLMPTNLHAESGKYTFRREYSDGAEESTRNDCFGWNDLSGLTLTLTEVKAETLVDGDSVFVKDLGRFHYDIASTATADDITVIALTSGIGRLLIDLSETPTLVTDLVGDGVADDTLALQGLLNAGGVIDLKPGTYNFTNVDLTVAGTVLRGSRKAILNCTVSTNQFAVHLQANDIRLQGFTLQGPLANSTYVQSHTGIYCNNTTYGPVVINYVRGLEILDVAVKNFGQYGIRLDYVQGSRIERNSLDYIGSHGIMLGAGCFDNAIDNNDIENIVPGQTDQGLAPYHPAYGITVTRDSSRDTTEAPISKRNRITNNRVKTVPSWIGIDSHGSQETLIEGNLVQQCSICIHMEDGNGGGSIVPSLNVNISNNICIGNTGVVGFVEGPGISLQGAGSASVLQSGISVVGNTLINCGYDITGLYTTRHGAIHALLVQGLTIVGNTIVTPHGIGIYLDGIQGSSIIGNTIDNVQLSNGDTYGILLGDGDVTTTIENNSFFGASPQINIASVSGTAGPDATYSIEVGRNIHHGTATKYENIEALHVWNGEYTSTQRDAISSVPNGMILFNETTNKLQTYNGSAWVDLH